jgi:hypothetical protein
MAIKWKNIIEIIREDLEIYYNQGYKPILRSIFYRLYSKTLISNTRSSYTSLDKATVKARLDGRLPINCFADNSRKVVANFNEIYYDPIDFIDRNLRIIKNIPKEYPNYIPRWYKQPKYVEVWIEKDAMTGTFQSILNGKDVVIVPNKGFTSLTFLYKCIKRLKDQQRKGKDIHILYYGDFDPSGDFMVDDLIRRLSKLGLRSDINLKLDEIHLQRVAVTPEQIKKYNLPFNPDKTTTEKMKRDSRTPGFVEKYGSLYAVELDALPALIPDEFKKLVIQSVERFYDDEIYTQILSNYSNNEINKLLKDKINQLSKELE